MAPSNRLKAYLWEANIHIARLQEILNALKRLYPLNVEKYQDLGLEEKNLLDSALSNKNSSTKLTSN